MTADIRAELADEIEACTRPGYFGYAQARDRALKQLPVRNAQLLAVLELHKQETDVHGYQVCGFRYCYDGGPHNDQHEWPCPTVRAIEEAGA